MAEVTTEVMANDSEIMATDSTTDIQVAETKSSWGLGKIVKTGAAILGAGVVAGMGASIGDRIVTKVCETMEVKAAGRKAKREAEAKVKAEQEAKKKAEAEAKEIPTSDEAKEVLEETK